jgi:adenylate kinase
LAAVLYFDVSADVVVDRIGQRRVCSQCGATYNLVSQLPQQEGKCDKCGAALMTRADDQPESIRKRLEVYQATIQPLLQYYEKKGILKIVNASLSVQMVGVEVAQMCGATAEA